MVHPDRYSKVYHPNVTFHDSFRPEYLSRVFPERHSTSEYQVGQTYYSIYWHLYYKVLALDTSYSVSCPTVKVQWEDGRVNEHLTSPGSDPIVSPHATIN